MSLFSTITHPETSGLKGFSPRGIGAFALILAAGMALGYAISVIDFTAETEAAASAPAMSHGEFLELNTTALWWEPVLPEPGVSQTRPAATVDPFIEANIGSYAALNQPWQVESSFTEMNTQLPVYGPQADNASPFVWANVGSYAALIDGWERAHAVDPGFVELNTSLGSTYVEPKSGPR